jgi:hypothetical protein
MVCACASIAAIEVKPIRKANGAFIFSPPLCFSMVLRLT